MASSSLIASVDSALICFKGGADVRDLKIKLRNLKALLHVSRVTKLHPMFQQLEFKRDARSLISVLFRCFRNAPNDLHVIKLPSNSLASILSRIERAVNMLIHADEIDIAESMTMRVRCFWSDLYAELLSEMYQSPNFIGSANELVGIVDCALENVPDFLSLIPKADFREQTDAFEVIDAFQVHMRFMKNVLVFAGQAGAEIQNVLMLHVQPIAIKVARVFVGVYARNFKFRSDFLEVIDMATDPQVYQAYSHALAMAKLSYTSLLIGDDVLRNLLDSLISLLWDALRHASNSAVKDEFKFLYERLRFSRAVLRHWETTLDEAISGQVVVLICDAGLLICSFHQPDPAQLSDLLQRFDVFQSQVIVALEDNPLEKANDHALSFGDFIATNVSDGDEKVLEMPVHHPPQGSTPHVLGFHGDEVATVLDRLTRGSKQLRIVPICGMAGLGKTTFALKLYNHSSVLHHFRACAWCTISQELNKKKVLLQLLNQIQPGDNSDMTEDDLANKLRQSLKGRRYLILLDDVWCPQVLNSLKASFPDDLTCSRIVLTSRCVDIHPHHLIDEHPHLLRLRDDSECLEILQAKLFHKEGWNCDLGMEFAKICKGLPLTLVIVSGLLATVKKEGWKAILDHLSSGNGVSGAEQCNIALELGYNHLPDHLQRCFLYFGAFPEDEEVSVKRLIRLWMAEGFVIKNELERIEDVGQEYVEKLIERSLVMVRENGSMGASKTLQIHDLLHGFCQRKMKQQNMLHLFLQTRDQISDFIEPCNLQRLSVHTPPTDFKESRLFYPGTLSLLFCFGEFCTHLFDMSFIIQIFQLLKVLHMERINLVNGIPNEIGLLTQLTYLSFRTSFPTIPSSIGNLFNLETFIAKFQTTDQIAFPHTLWNLQKLKYFHIKSASDGFTLPVQNLENSSSLLDLETLRGVVFYTHGTMDKQLQKFPHVRRLKCTILPCKKERCPHNLAVLNSLSQLQSLSVSIRDKVRCEFGSTVENLRKLKLNGFKLSKNDVVVIRKFPNLEVLKLSHVHFPGKTLEMKGENFPKLRVFKLNSCSSLERWTTFDEELPSLQKFDFMYCQNLKEIPSWLETSSTLEEIQVVRCSSTLESLVRGIEEVQKDYGDLVKVHIISK